MDTTKNMMKKSAAEGLYLFKGQPIKAGTLLKITDPFVAHNSSKAYTVSKPVDGFVCFVSVEFFNRGDHPQTLLTIIHPEFNTMRIPFNSHGFSTWLAQTFDIVEVNTDE